MAIYCVDVLTCRGGPQEVHSDMQNAPGTIRLFSDGNRYVYLQGVASTVTGDAVVWDSLGRTLRSTTTTLGPFAIASWPIGANQWGWYFHAGLYTVNAVGVALADTLAYATATPGVLDDAVVATAKVWNAVFRSGGAGGASFQVGPGGGFIGPDA